MNRFHNKYHRHNHHTNPSDNEPDSSHDPIASPEDPFKGEFHILGKLSATSGALGSLTVSNNITVDGSATFHGSVLIDTPITYVVEHHTIVPKSTTEDFYFKIDSDYTNYPLVEMYIQGSSVFHITSSKNIGIGTIDPVCKLDVRGDIKGYTVSAVNVNITSTLSADGNSYFNTITTANISQLGYLQIGYINLQHTYIKTLSGNNDLYFYTGNNLNAVMHPNNNNRFTGKLGIATEPTETLTINGQLGFRKTGAVILDNSINDSLRVITNRYSGGAFNDIDPHYFSFTSEGRFTVGDVPQSYTDNCSSILDSSRGNFIDNKDTGKLLSLTNITENKEASGPALDFYRSNGSFTILSPVSANQLLGSIRATGAYSSNPNIVDACIPEQKNASVDFFAYNTYTADSQGSYITMSTTHTTDRDLISTERLKINHDGNVGVNTISSAPSNYLYRTLLEPNWKFTVTDYEGSPNPAAVIIAGSTASSMMQLIGGEGAREQVALKLSDRNNTLPDNINHIEFTQGQNDASVARISMTHTSLNASSGGSLLFSTTYDTSTPVLPFERARITPDGDFGVGTKLPISRLHVHDDNKKVAQASGTARDVLTVSTRNNLNSIYLSSVNTGGRLTVRDAGKDFVMSSHESETSIRFHPGDDVFAGVFTPDGRLGINVTEDEIRDCPIKGNSKLFVNGDVRLFNDTANNVAGSGARLYFAKNLNTELGDSVYIYRHDTAFDETALRVNIGDNWCGNFLTNAANQDYFSVGNHRADTGLWESWVDVGACNTKFHTNLFCDRDTTITRNLSVLQDVTIAGTLSVVNPNSEPLKINGDLYVNGNIYATKDITAYWPVSPGPPGGWPSDERLKFNITPISASLEKIDNINGVFFNWDEEKQDTHKGRDVGVIAQEIEKILPEIVHENSAGYKTVQYEKIIPLLIECIKDLKKEVEELKYK